MSEQHESVGQHQVGQSDADTTDDSLPHGLRSASAHAPEAPPAIGSDIDVSFSSPVDETLLQNVQQRAHLHLARSVQPDQLQEACVMEAPQGVSHEINCNGPTQDNHVYDGSGSLRLVKQGCKYDKDIQAVVWHESPSTASQGCGLNTGCGPALVPSSCASTASIPTSPIAQVDDEVVGTASGSLLQFPLQHESPPFTWQADAVALCLAANFTGSKLETTEGNAGSEREGYTGVDGPGVCASSYITSAVSDEIHHVQAMDRPVRFHWDEALVLQCEPWLAVDGVSPPGDPRQVDCPSNLPVTEDCIVSQADAATQCQAATRTGSKLETTEGSAGTEGDAYARGDETEACASSKLTSAVSNGPHYVQSTHAPGFMHRDEASVLLSDLWSAAEDVSPPGEPPQVDCPSNLPVTEDCVVSASVGNLVLPDVTPALQRSPSNSSGAEDYFASARVREEHALDATSAMKCDSREASGHSSTQACSCLKQGEQPPGNSMSHGTISGCSFVALSLIQSHQGCSLLTNIRHHAVVQVSTEDLYCAANMV